MPDTLTARQLAEIKARCEKTTTGPWTMFDYPDGRKLLAGRWGAVIHCPDAPIGISAEDADFIAHAREDLPWAVSRLEQLQRDVQRVANLFAEGLGADALHTFKLLQAALDRSRQEAK